jgi:hypothetical protein
MKKSILLLTFLLLSILFSCGSSGKIENVKSSEEAKNMIGKSYFITARIAEKTRIIKGETQAKSNFFLERSIQDYFIKFCESNVSRAELESYMENQRASIKILHAEVEYREGEWDRCEEMGKVATRKGAYIIILRLLE